MGHLEFITFSGSPELSLQDSTSRRLIRTTATRASRSKGVLEASRDHQSQSDVVRQSSQRGRMTRFRALPTSVSRTVEVIKPDASSTVLPLPAPVSIWEPNITPLGGQAWTLLHYYRFCFRTRSWAINAKKDWFAFVIQDQAATHATLSFVSLNRDLEEGSVVTPSSLHHRAKALQLVRQRLANTSAPPEDSVIGAVALLAITEGLEGQSAASAQHMQALEKLVNLRGGFRSLRRNEALSRLVAWADLCHTSTFQSRPRIPKLFEMADVDLDNGGSALQREDTKTFRRSIKQRMPPVVYNLVRLLGAVPRLPPNDETPANQRQNISRLIYHLNQLSYSIYHDGIEFEGNVNANVDVHGQIAKVLCYATYLYIALVLRQMPRRTTIVVERARKLSEAIRDLESVTCHNDLEEPYCLIVFWSYTVLFCSLLPHEQVGHISKSIRPFVTYFRIKTIKALEDKLGEVSWISGYAHSGLNTLLMECYLSTDPV